jgi:hypothetical protein
MLAAVALLTSYIPPRGKREPDELAAVRVTLLSLRQDAERRVDLTGGSRAPRKVHPRPPRSQRRSDELAAVRVTLLIFRHQNVQSLRRFRQHAPSFRERRIQRGRGGEVGGICGSRIRNDAGDVKLGQSPLSFTRRRGEDEAHFRTPHRHHFDPGIVQRRVQVRRCRIAPAIRAAESSPTRREA